MYLDWYNNLVFNNPSIDILCRWIGKSQFKQLLNLVTECHYVLPQIHLGWTPFGRLDYISRSSIPQSLKTKVFNQCFLPVMTYGAEAWTLTSGLIHSFNISESVSAMERTVIGISGGEYSKLSPRTKLINIVRKIHKLNLWAGYVCWRVNGQWSRLVDKAYVV